MKQRPKKGNHGKETSHTSVIFTTAFYELLGGSRWRPLEGNPKEAADLLRLEVTHQPFTAFLPSFLPFGVSTRYIPPHLGFLSLLCFPLIPVLSIFSDLSPVFLSTTFILPTLSHPSTHILFVFFPVTLSFLLRLHLFRFPNSISYASSFPSHSLVPPPSPFPNLAFENTTLSSWTLNSLHVYVYFFFFVVEFLYLTFVLDSFYLRFHVV